MELNRGAVELLILFMLSLEETLFFCESSTEFSELCIVSGDISSLLFFKMRF
jgi:hypothetical protein